MKRRFEIGNVDTYFDSFSTKSHSSHGTNHHGGTAHDRQALHAVVEQLRVDVRLQLQHLSVGGLDTKELFGALFRSNIVLWNGRIRKN